MTDAECRDVYQQLVAMLGDLEVMNGHKIDWLVEEVDQVIRAGEIIDEPSENSSIAIPTSERYQIISETLTVQISPAPPPAQNRYKQSSREFTTTREYTPKEILILLIDAIESVVVQTTLIEREVTHFFQREGEEHNISPEVRFVSEEEDSQPIILSYDSAINRVDQAMALKKLLNQLRSEVEE
jgi:hypothetical protein